MAHRFKLKLKLSRAIIPSLQVCRPKDPSGSVHTPVPAVYRQSPVTSKVFDISFPSNDNNNNNLLPAPPPTTPADGHFTKRHVVTDVDVSVECRCHHVVSKDHEPNHTTSSPVLVDRNKKKKTIFGEEDPEREALISTSTKSLSKKVNTNMKQIRRHRRKASMDNKESDHVSAAGTVSPVTASVFRRRIPGTVDGKVRESVAVMKKSVDPYEDFKRSMLEMILQKQMFEAKDLEQLLLCFLSLNSRKYHGIIVEAFSDIWDILFCD